MLPISDENERGQGPAFVSLALIAINVVVFLVLQGAGATTEGAEFTYGYSAVPYEITNNVDLTVAPKDGNMVKMEDCFEIAELDANPLAEIRAKEQELGLNAG